MQTAMNIAPRSRLRAGDWVQVRTKEEILATLDANGRLEELPFMPEMLPYCGKRMRVGKRAHKTCDPAAWHRRQEDGEYRPPGEYSLQWISP